MNKKSKIIDVFQRDPPLIKMKLEMPELEKAIREGKNIMDKPSKPTPKQKCPDCESKLYITSIIHQNGQVNFGCINQECPLIGFIHNGEFFFSGK